MPASTRCSVGTPRLATFQQCANVPWIEFCSLFGAWEQEGDPRGQPNLVVVGRAVCVIIYSQKSYHWVGSCWPRERVTFHPLMVNNQLGVIHGSAAILLTTTSKATIIIKQLFLGLTTFHLSCMRLCFISQSCPTLHDPMDCSLLGSSIHGIFQARILECHALLQEIFPPQELNGGLLHCRRLLYHLSYIEEAKTFTKSYVISSPFFLF